MIGYSKKKKKIKKNKTNKRNKQTKNSGNCRPPNRLKQGRHTVLLINYKT